MEEIPNSSYLDYSTWHQSKAHTVGGAFGFDPTVNTPAAPDATIRIGIVLPRLHDPSELDALSWGERQTKLNDLGQDGVWARYGASTTLYDTITGTLAEATIDGVAFDLTPLGQDYGYVSSAASRTIWLELNPEQFQTLFGTELYVMPETSNNPGALYWNGNLVANTDILPEGSVAGLWVDNDVPNPNDEAYTDGSWTPPQGPQSIGNASTDETDFLPNALAELYNFPLDQSIPTSTIGLIESQVGDTLPTGSTVNFVDQLDAYRTLAGITSPIDFTEYDSPNATLLYDEDGAGERSLDISIVATAAPGSPVVIYAGSGVTDDSDYSSYQTAIFDTVNNPAVINGSTTTVWMSNPDSPFYEALSELFVDGMLSGRTLVISSDDGGSSSEIANGLTNLWPANVSAYALLAGGTSLSTFDAAASDETLHDQFALAAIEDPATLWTLMQSGLKTWPADATSGDVFWETAWNQYYLQGKDMEDGGYTQNWTSTGGVDTNQPVPFYQSDFGLTPSINGPVSGTGRGVPDVSILAGGNANYSVLGAGMDDLNNLSESGGTSAAAPMWSSLTAQFNAIFKDQHLPQLGFYNDLLYIAAAVSPGAFNDVTAGNNISSYYYDDDGNITLDGYSATATGYGYQATDGYDLVTGLGSPNGLLLARALTTIAHTQISFADLPDVLDKGTGNTWQSGATQSLLFQSQTESPVEIKLGSDDTHLQQDGSIGAYAWTSQLAQQSLQVDFSDQLVTLFDGQSQGSLYQAEVAAGTDVHIKIDHHDTQAPQFASTADFGFVSFASNEGSVEVARAVAVATTVDAADNQEAVVRLRQNGVDNVSVTFYRVDDLAGNIGDLAPGEAGYAAAAALRAYQVAGGGTAIAGAGYGQYSDDARITGVDAGDLIAMTLTNGANTFYAFAQANEQVDGQDVGHLWSYGLNTWGWEDRYGGGDRDFNDLVVQLDFSSAFGSAWIA